MFAAQLPLELGGQGLDMRGAAVVLEASGYGLLGGPVLLLDDRAGTGGWVRPSMLRTRAERVAGGWSISGLWGT